MWMFLLFAAAPPQTVEVFVSAPGAGPGRVIEVRTTWLGEDRTMVLTDDGSQPGDVPADGIYTGVWTGEAVRVLPISIVERVDGEERLLFSGVERVYQPSDRLSFATATEDPPRAIRMAAPYTAQRAEIRESARVAASIGWAGLIFAYVAWLVGRAWPARAR